MGRGDWAGIWPGRGGFQELSGLIAALSWVFIDFWALSFREMAGGTGKLPVGWFLVVGQSSHSLMG